jgi:hypothetical protein
MGLDAERRGELEDRGHRCPGVAYVLGYEWEADTAVTGIKELYIGYLGTRRSHRGRLAWTPTTRPAHLDCTRASASRCTASGSPTGCRSEPREHRLCERKVVGRTHNGTVTLIEKCSGAQLSLKQSRPNTVGSFTFQAAASGAVT